MTNTDTEGLACQTPLHELLLGIPIDARLQWDETDGLLASHSAPVGKMAHEAAGKLIDAARQQSEMAEQIMVLREIVEAFVDIEQGTDATGFDPSVEQMLMDLATEARQALANTETGGRDE